MMFQVRDRLSGLFWLGISVFICVESLESDIGTFHFPGPGFLPFWSGVALGILALILLTKTWLQRKEDGSLSELWKGKDWNKVIIILTSLLAYAILLPRLGYLLATFGVMTILFNLKGKQGLLTQGAVALATVLVTYFVFSVWLGVPLPKGILGF